MNQQKLPDFFYDIFHASLPRHGPGDDASTRKALDILLAAGLKPIHARSSETLNVLDIGCGAGAQTIALAKQLDAEILAVDNHQPFLDELRRRALSAGVSEKIRTCLKDMRDLRLEDGAFDLIWSEGALFVMGFREGLEACRPLLAPGGMFAASELVWLLSDPPAECRKFFAQEYPPMVGIDDNLAAIANSGYEVLHHFILPESSWLEPFYHPLEYRLRMMRKKDGIGSEQLEMIENIQKEIEIFRKYSSYYGYAFYLMRRCQD